MKLLIIIPAYNEEASIVNTVEDLKRVCPHHDFIVVNDGSADATAQLCREHGYPLLDLPVNLGLSGAVQAGMKFACRKHYDAAVQYDADGQHCGEYLDAMMHEIENGYDIVIGSRFVTEKKPLTARMLGSRLICLAIRLTTGRELRDPTSGMRMYNRRMIRQFADLLNIEPEPDTIAYVMKCGARVREIQVEMKERTAGESYLTLFSSMRYMVQMGISILLVQPFRRKIRF